MKEYDEDKEYTLNNYLSIVYSFSDKEYQKRVWIEGRGPEVNDYDETSCYIAGEGEDIIKNYKSFEITESQYIPLKRFYDIYEKFDDNDYYTFKTENDLIHSPQWKIVMDAAKEVLTAFNYKKNC